MSRLKMIIAGVLLALAITYWVSTKTGTTVMTNAASVWRARPWKDTILAIRSNVFGADPNA